MSDQCKPCYYYNNFSMCELSECFVKENWYAIKLRQSIADLEKKFSNYKERNYDPAESIRLNGEVMKLKAEIERLKATIDRYREKSSF